MSKQPTQSWEVLNTLSCKIFAKLPKEEAKEVYENILAEWRNENLTFKDYGKRTEEQLDAVVKCLENYDRKAEMGNDSIIFPEVLTIFEVRDLAEAYYGLPSNFSRL